MECVENRDVGETLASCEYSVTTSNIEVKSLISEQSQLDIPSLGTPVNEDASTKKSRSLENDQQDCKLSELLGKSQYEPLRDQLANMAAAKASGNFVFQVAASIESLMKCSELITDQTLSEFKHRSESTTRQTALTLDALSSELGRINAEHKKKMDGKLSKLSCVLDEIKANQEELSRYRQLLTSLTCNTNSEL